MKYYAGMDVSLEETAICIVDEAGAIVKEMRADSEPRALADRYVRPACRWSGSVSRPVP